MNRPDPHIAALKIWLTGLVLGPIILFLFEVPDLISGRSAWTCDAGPLLETFLLALIVGGILSLPSVIILGITISIQYRYRQSKPAFWRAILFVSFLLTIMPFAFLMGLFQMNGDNEIIRMAIAYLAGIWIGVYWAFRGVRFDEP